MKTFKQFISEASKIKAEDYEAAIVLGWYKLHDRPVDDKTGVTTDIMKTLNNNQSVLDSGYEIAKKVLKYYPDLKDAPAEQYGRSKTKLTEFWKSHGATDVTPKTDILIGDKRFSLKIGEAQLMSGGKSESMATFYAALKNSDSSLQKDDQFIKVQSILESFVTSTLAPTQLRPIIKSGTDPIVNAAEKAHKECMYELGTLFENNRQFKIEFAREAMSGFEKYGKNNNAAAEFMLVATHDGSKVSIHSVYDDNYCAKIADNMKLQARFKTTSRKIKNVKTGEYNYWSVISLIVNAMTEDIQEYQGQYLSENIFSKIKNKLSSFITKTKQKIYNVFKKGVSFLLKFLKIEPEISVNNIIKF